MITAITFQALANFTASRYAAEVSSRMMDPKNANGYYPLRGDLEATATSSDTIEIGTGLFIVQGRQIEITEAESVTVPITNGYVGYVVARLETFHPSDENNVSLVVYTAESLDKISLQQDDIYQEKSNEENLIYEYPLYSFEIENSKVTNLVRQISSLEEVAKLAELAEKASSDAEKAVNKADEIEEKENAFEEQTDSRVDELEERIITSEGTGIYIDDKAIVTLKFEGTVSDDEIVIILDGGGA